MLLAGASVLIHYEALNLLERVIRKVFSHRKRLVVTMVGLLLAHCVEIWIYGGAYTALSLMPQFGEIVNTTPEPGVLDRVYFSAMVYTTVGFGDMVPTGALRMVTATEALVGLSLITWSASFTFIQMQKIWR